MAQKPVRKQSYYELAESKAAPLSIFILLIAVFVTLSFIFTLPVLETVLTKFLSGEVYNNGKSHPQYIDMKEPLIKTNYYLRWGVDIYLKTAQEARYWFNPVVSFMLISSIIGLLISVIISTLMPQKLGLMRHKIDREIVNLLDKLAFVRYGVEDDKLALELSNEIKNADLRDISENYSDSNLTLDDIRILQRAIKWSESNLWYRFFHINDGITMYMRFYFTIKYSNAVLGFVYIGAAVLIIIIGLRGLKFIPPTEPSLILFALGLEFSLLIMYALTLMYTRQEEDSEFGQGHQNYGSVNMSSDFGSSREIEKLLRVFIKSKDKK